MTRGNSKTTAGNGSIVSERKGDRNEVSLGLEGNYGQTEETQSDGSKQMKTTVQNEKGYAKYRRLFTDRDYAYINGELNQDKIADIKYRLIIGPGLGRYFIKSNDHTLGGEAGPSWIRDKVGDIEGDRFALRVAQNYEWKMSETANIWENVEYMPALDDFNNYLVNGEIGAEAAINSKLSLRLVAQDHYNNKPAAGKEKNDLVLTAGVGCKF
jgi:putative salt-induced outer membrane protein YdiY